MTATEFAQTVTQLPTEKQNELLSNLKNVLTEDEYKTTASFLSLFGMFSDPEKYEAMKNAVRERVCEEFYRHAN